MGRAELRQKRVTSIDIAREAGVSQATVSRVLNGGSVAPVTAQRVLTVIDRLGYRPNLLARGLVTRRSGVLGVVVADITNPFYPEMLQAVDARVQENGYRMLVQNVGSSSEDDCIRLMMEAQVDGAIFTTALRSSRGVLKMVEAGYAVVLTNRMVDADVDAISADNASGAAFAADHLIQLGHKRIAVISGHPDASTTEERTKGFKAELARHSVPLEARLQATTNFDYARTYQVAMELLSLSEPPTAVFCHNDLMAIAVLNAASARGVRVPDELSIVGFDDIPMASWESFQLTTVHQPQRHMADSAVDLLISKIGNPLRPHRTIVYPCQLMVRSTSGPPSI